MVKIIKKNGIAVKLEAIGHANADKKGKDVVCSAFSFLVQSISMYILNSGINIEIRGKDKLIIDLFKLKNFNKEIYKYLIFSIKILERKYNEYIDVKEIEI